MGWAHAYRDILRSSHISYKVAPTKQAKAAVLETVAQDIQNATEISGGSLPPNLQQVSSPLHTFGRSLTSLLKKIKNWFHNVKGTATQHAGPLTGEEQPSPSKPCHPPGAQKFLKMFGTRDAVASLFSNRVSAETRKVSQDEPGSTSYLASYQTALTTIVQVLTEEEREEAEKLAEKWNREGAPAAQKKK